MKNNRICTKTAIGMPIFLIIGCATGPITPVIESNRDSSGSFEGRWIGKITNTPPIQQSTGQVAYMRCSDGSGRNMGIFSVTGGEIAYSYRGNRINTYVNAKGGFKLVIPIDKGRFSGGDETFTANKDTLTISGSLGTGKGFHTITSSDFGGAGCTSSISFNKT